MCGVIGFYSSDPQEFHLQAFCRLFEASKIRGLHAFGFSTWSDANGKTDGIRTFRSHDLAEVQLELLTKFKRTPPQVIIGHSRYSTSGDWQNHANNQPIKVGSCSLVFNGVISQAPKADWEKQYGKRYVTENDGEIFVQKVLDGEDWEGFVANGSFSFAGIFLKDGGEAWAIRNRRRPLWRATLGNGLFFGSTKDIFERAGGFAEITELAPGVPFRLRSFSAQQRVVG